MATVLDRARDLFWLSNLGRPTPAAQDVYRTTLEEGRAFVEDAAREKLTGAATPASPLDQFDWLSVDGPNPNAGLERQLQEGASERLGSARQSVAAEVLAALRDLPVSEWLVVGATDFRPAVRKSAVHAFRMAVAEAHYGQKAFWHRVVALYEEGLWPAATNGGGKILAL